MDRGRSKAILQSSLLAHSVVKKFNLNPILFTTNKKNSWQVKMYKTLGVSNIFYSRDIQFFLTNFDIMLKTIVNCLFSFIKYKNNFLRFINEFSIEKAEIGHLSNKKYIKNEKKYLKKNI